MGVFGQRAPIQVERRWCYCCRRRGHLVHQCPHLADSGQTWERSVWENEQAGDNLPTMDKAAIRVGEIVWPKDERSVEEWDDGESEQGHYRVGEQIREGNEPGEGEDDETAESNDEELRMLGEYLTPEFLGWL
ncbi:unnamed protein product [Gordionus sp. m RMFG-2023]